MRFVTPGISLPCLVSALITIRRMHRLTLTPPSLTLLWIGKP